MFSFYLAAAETEMALGDKLALGGQVSLLGLGSVFGVLALLWGLVELMQLLLTGFSGDKKKKAAPAPAKAETPAAAPITAAPAAAANDLEIVAVITAAVAAASGSSPSSFRVVSFKRANDRFSSGK